MITALVTRPREDSEGVARALAALGIEARIEPLLAVEFLGEAVDSTGIQGILVTSGNGIRALAKAIPDRHWPVWTVGDASARTARDLGFQRVESAGGDVTSLAALVQRRCDPKAGALLHAAGSVTAGDLGGTLAEAGFQVRRLVLYRTNPATALTPALITDLRGGAVPVALFFSPRTAATFATLAAAAGLDAATGSMTAYALSPAVAHKLAALPWAALRVAVTPTQAALLAALEEDLAAGRYASADPRIIMTDTEQPPTPPESATAPAAAEPEPPAEPTDKPARKRRRWGPAAAGIVVVAAAAVAAAMWSESRHPSSNPPAPPVATFAPPPETMAELRAELDATREHMRTLEARLAAQPQGGADLTPVDNRLIQAEAAIKTLQGQPQIPAKLADSVDALQKQVADLQRTSADAAAVLRLADRLEKTEAALRDIQARRSSASALMLAVGQLREALAKAMPYDAELRAVKALAGGDAEVAPQIDILKPHAVAGIPTFPVLVARFGALAPAIVRAQVLPDGGNWWRQTLDRLASLVSVRREDGADAGSNPAAVVARAEAALGQGDLGGAVTEIATLSGGPADQSSAWLADARARLEADKAVSELTAHVVAAIGAGQ